MDILQTKKEKKKAKNYHDLYATMRMPYRTPKSKNL